MKKFFHSVAFRLSLRFTVILTVAVLVLSIAFTSILTVIINNQKKGELKTAADDIEDAFLNADFYQTDDFSPLLPYYLTYSVYTQEEVLFTNDPYLPHLGDTKGKVKTYFEKDFFVDGDLHILYIARSLTTEAETVTILIASNLDTDSTTKLPGEIPRVTLIVIFPILLISFLVSLFITRRTIAPVVKMTSSANQISSSNLDSRLPVSKKADELDELAETFNDLFQRLKSDFDRERQFTSDVSHELKTPVAVILGQSNLLRRWGKDDPAQLEKSLTTIINETKSMEAIINNLLQMSRLESGRLQPENQIINLKEMIERLKDETLSVKPETIFNFDESLNYKVIADSELLHQVFTVVISNSLKFTPSPATLTIDCSLNKKDETVIIEIEDNGPGFGDENIPHVFERFYRGDSSHTRSVGGSGLGLSIAKTIIESMNGKISAHRAKNGQGAMIRIELLQA